MLKFAHFSDIHLGYKQYGLEERFQDFYETWEWSVEQVIKADVDFVLIAGDLFQKRNTDPRAFIHARSGLERFAELGIPVVAIEGNHDRFIHSNEFSWLRVLAEEDLLILLDCVDENGQIQVDGYDVVQKRGGSILLPCGVRIVGQRYRGEKLKQDLVELEQQLSKMQRADFQIFMAHTGVETDRPIADPDHVCPFHLQPLRKYFDYVALGHIHEKKVVDRWIYQPGSLETCSFAEAKPNVEHGFFFVSIDQEKKSFSHRFIVPTRRDFLALHANIKHCKTTEEFHKQLHEQLQLQFPKKKMDMEPILSIHISISHPHLDRYFDRDVLQHFLEQTIKPLHVPKVVLSRDVPSVESKKKELVDFRTLEHRVLSENVRKQGVEDNQVNLYVNLLKELKASEVDFETVLEKVDSFLEEIDALDSNEEEKICEEAA